LRVSGLGGVRGPRAFFARFSALPPARFNLFPFADRVTADGFDFDFDLDFFF
jgi:hypothetical protein